MSSKTKKKRLTKTEYINVRVDPQIKYGLELLARTTHRSLSSVVDWAIRKLIDDPVEGLKRDNDIRGLELLTKLWDTQEFDRLLKLYAYKRDLLTFEDDRVLKVITESEHYKSLYNIYVDRKVNESEIVKKICDELRDYLPDYKGVANGSLPKEGLPKYIRKEEECNVR